MSGTQPDCEMSKGQMLRALVNECLTAAADEIFALVYRTFAQYEEELRRCKEENQKKQHRLISVHVIGSSSLSQEHSGTQIIIEEPEEKSVKQEEEEQLPALNPVYVKSEELSSLLQRTEHKEENQDGGGAGGDFILDLQGQLHCETEEQTENFSENDEYRELPSISSAQMETGSDYGSDVHHYNLDQITQDTSTASHNSSLFTTCTPETSATVKVRRTRRTGVRGERKRHECPICKKEFTIKQNLETHTRTHTGERPYSCFVCKKTFIHVSHLNAHMKTHTGMKPYGCTICSKKFAQKGNLTVHMRTHTGERPYSCSVCEKKFSQRSHLDKHVKGNHPGEKF